MAIDPVMLALCRKMVENAQARFMGLPYARLTTKLSVGQTIDLIGQECFALEEAYKVLRPAIVVLSTEELGSLRMTFHSATNMLIGSVIVGTELVTVVLTRTDKRFKPAGYNEYVFQWTADMQYAKVEEQVTEEDASVDS